MPWSTTPLTIEDAVTMPDLPATSDELLPIVKHDKFYNATGLSPEDLVELSPGSYFVLSQRDHARPAKYLIQGEIDWTAVQEMEDGDSDSDDTDEEGENDEASDGSEDDMSALSADDSDAEKEADEDDVEQLSEAGVYVVEEILRDDNGVVQDIHVSKLMYTRNNGDRHANTFQIFGNAIHRTPRDTTESTKANTSIEFSSLKAILQKESVQKYADLACALEGRRCHGGLIPDDSPARCLANCNDGWLETLQELHEISGDFFSRALLDHSIVCPVCLGLELTMEQQTLRQQLDVLNIVDMAETIDFYHKLNPARRERGYSFVQYDEREWGYLFDDMNTEDEDSQDGDNEGRYEAWDEALDPNAAVHIRQRPVPDEVFAALPRKTFQEYKDASTDAKANDTTMCAICRSDFDDAKIVIELPCKHIFCGSGCAEQWLKQSGSCPSCRAIVDTLAAAEEDREGASDTGSEGIHEIDGTDMETMSSPGSRDAIDEFCDDLCGPGDLSSEMDWTREQDTEDKVILESV